MQRRYVGSTICMGSTPAIRAEALRSSARLYQKNAVSGNSDGILEMVDSGILGFRIISVDGRFTGEGTDSGETIN
jgi:hypothetical protein